MPVAIVAALKQTTYTDLFVIFLGLCRQTGRQHNWQTKKCVVHLWFSRWHLRCKPLMAAKSETGNPFPGFGLWASTRGTNLIQKQQLSDAEEHDDTLINPWNVCTFDAVFWLFDSLWQAKSEGEVPAPRRIESVGWLGCLCCLQVLLYTHSRNAWSRIKVWLCKEQHINMAKESKQLKQSP